MVAIAGPDALELRTPVEHHGEGFTTVAEFAVNEGQRLPFALSYFASYESPPSPLDPWAALEATTQTWQN